jgi:Glycosyl hydrolase family 99
MRQTRRQFLGAMMAASMARPPRARATAVPNRARSWLDGPPFPIPQIGWRGDSSVAAAVRAGTLSLPPQIRHPVAGVNLGALGAALRRRFPDLRRRFIFEYYPWYASDPWRHWDQWDRVPPVDIAATSMPLLGPYDSRVARVIEEHARWIAETGIGAINISWWGRDGFEDRAVPLIMDVMRAHDIKVTFHLEPYADQRSTNYADDVAYLLRTYGEARRWDTLLLLGPSGREAPVLKSFGTILPVEGVDCHGVRFKVPNYVSDGDWRRQTDRARDGVRRDFDTLTLLADSLDIDRLQRGGFDGLAVYDNFFEPSSWREVARSSSTANLVFSFNINPGFDGIALRNVEPGSCYSPTPFEPETDALDWRNARSRAVAHRASAARVVESCGTTLSLQSDARLANARRGFFLVYVNSFNEWHEGHQFEPAKDHAALTAVERQLGYHNAEDGQYRHALLKRLMAQILEG